MVSSEIDLMGNRILVIGSSRITASSSWWYVRNKGVTAHLSLVLLLIRQFDLTLTNATFYSCLSHVEAFLMSLP